MRWMPTNKSHILLEDTKIQPKYTMLTFNIRVTEILKIKWEIHKITMGWKLMWLLTGENGLQHKRLCYSDKNIEHSILHLCAANKPTSHYVKIKYLTELETVTSLIIAVDS